MILRSFLKRNCKSLYCILYSKRNDTWKKSRYFWSALAGTFFAWLMCKCIFASFIISKRYEKPTFLLTILIVASGYIFTDAMKCITLMMFISLVGKSGRSYMRALSFAFVISGPIENLSSNTEEIIRAFSCSKVLALNLTRTRFDLMTKPFQKTLIHMKDDIEDVQATFNDLRDVTKVLHEEIMSEGLDTNTSYFMNAENETILESNNNQSSKVRNREIFQRSHHSLRPQDIENQYKNKFKRRCLKQLDNGKARCRKAFVNALEKCYDKMPFIIKTLICWPFKVDFICKINVLGDPEIICDPAVPSNFGENYYELMATENQLYEGSTNVKVDYKIMKPEEMPGVKSAEETAKYMANEFKIRKQIFNSILKIMQQFLGFMILKIVYASVLYHKKYKEDFNHDNIYITKYFKHLDERRKSIGKPSLLPLKKYESRDLIATGGLCHRTHEESQSILFYLLQFSLEIICASFFLFLDYMIVSVLLIIRNNSEMSFVQEGEHTIKFQIRGSGLIAKLLRKTMGNFNMHETVSTYLTNENCLPNPTSLPKRFYLKLMLLYSFVLLLIYQSSNFLRMRRLICGYFYRKREKKRIIYLYNYLLKQRRSIKAIMIREAEYNYANRQIRLRANIFLILRSKWPRYFNWLIKFHMGRRKCVICGELEDSKFVFCQNSTCNVAYCNDCFNDMENNCWICNVPLSVEIILNFNDFFEQYSFA